MRGQILRSILVSREPINETGNASAMTVHRIQIAVEDGQRKLKKILQRLGLDRVRLPRNRKASRSRLKHQLLVVALKQDPGQFSGSLCGDRKRNRIGVELIRMLLK